MKQYKTPFYKTDFYITGAEKRQRHTDPIQYKFTKVSGWGLTLEAPNGDIIEIGLDRRPTRWKVTADRLKNPDTLQIANALADYILQEGATEK